MDAGYRLLAAKYVRKQAKQLRAQLDGIHAAENIEFVHRARVASRRLKTAMRMFDECFRSKQIKRWKKGTRRLRSELGEARDKDVQIELLRSILASLTKRACFSGISRLLVEWEYHREDLQRKVVKAVDRLERDGTLKEMTKATKRVLVKARSREAHVQSPASFLRAEQEIFRRLDRLLALQDCLDRPEDKRNHHAMRIAAKHLRYTMEIARPIYSGRLDATLDAIKQVQALLGEVHDCDVWQEQLDRFANDERERIIANYGHDRPFSRLDLGIEYLRQDRRRHRQQCYDNLVNLWRKLNANEVWEKLVAIVQSDGHLFDAPESLNPESLEKDESVAQSAIVADNVVDNPAFQWHDPDGLGIENAPPALSPPRTAPLVKRPRRYHQPVVRL
jgi:CHAD domain-containing protein